MSIRLLLVDDHQVVRAGLRTLLSAYDDVEVAGEAGTVAEAIERAAALHPDVILMDLRLPDGSGIEACREILSALPQTRILFLTAHSDEQAVLSTVLAGACGYLLKDIRHDALVGAIRDAAAGRRLEKFATQPVMQRMELVQSLSTQERRVLALVVEGRTNREIAAALGLSDKTVKNYLSNAFQKLQVTRRAHAAALFLRGRADGESE